MKNLLQVFFNHLFKPHNIIFFTLSLSIFAWLLPSLENFSRGFTQKEPLTDINICFLILWYANVFIVAVMFYRFGRRSKPLKLFDRFANLDSLNVYIIYTGIGLLGFGMAVLKIFSKFGFAALFSTLFVDFQANAIEEALYDDYSIGILSLRYVLIIVFGIALYRIQTKKEYTFLNIFNVVAFLVYTLLLGRRLQILVGFFVYFSLSNRNHDLFKKIKLKVLLISLTLVLALITLASTIRNYNTYADRGNTNPITATLANMVEYLDSPFQASLEIGNNLDKATNGVNYQAFTNINESLNTNSALSMIIYDSGWFGFVYVFLVYGSFAFLAGFLSRNESNYLFVGYPIIIYAFAEVWRVNLFETGLFKTLLVISMAIPIVISIYNRAIRVSKPA